MVPVADPNFFEKKEGRGEGARGSIAWGSGVVNSAGPVHVSSTFSGDFKFTLWRVI